MTALDRAVDTPHPYPAGWPRPRSSGRPVPYVTEVGWAGDVRWTSFDSDAVIECVSNFLCQVCGLECPDGDLYVAVSRGAVIAYQEIGKSPMRSAPGGALHRRCARLSAVACPHLVAQGAAVLLLRVQRDALRVYEQRTTRGVLRPWGYEVVGGFEVVEDWG